jgi:hypothetical protein
MMHVGKVSTATWCASTADGAFTKCESDTTASVLALLELSEEPGFCLPAATRNAVTAADIGLMCEGRANVPHVAPGP